MAVLNKMRERAGAIFIGLAVAFLLMIVFEWGAQGDFFRSSRPANAVGEVNGYPIRWEEYEEVANNLRQQKLSETKKKTLNDAEEAEIRDQAWEQAIVNKLIEQKVDEYGITVTDQEIRDLIFYNPPEFLKRGFYDSTGHFMEQEYFQAVRDPRNDTIVSRMVHTMREELKRLKLQGYLQALGRVTNTELWERYDNEHSKATINAVRIEPKGDPNQFASQVSEDEIKKYYDQYSWKYKHPESRKIQFVLFRETPTARDSALLVDRLASLKKRWENMPVTEPDSVVAEMAADYTDEPYKHEGVQFPMMRGYSNVADLITAQPGQVVILRGQGVFMAARVFNTVDTGTPFFHSRHILIGKGTPENKDSARQVAQRVYEELKAGANFADLARKYSVDGTAQSGGDLGWVGAKQFVESFEKTALSAPLNVVQPPVESQFGFHIIEVLGRAKKSIVAGMIPVMLKTSSTTSKLVEQQARIFRERANKEGFDKVAKEMNLRVITDAPEIVKGGQPIFNDKSLVNHIFTLKKGDILEPIRIPAIRGTVVIQLTDIKPKGISPLDSTVKPDIIKTLAKKKFVESVAAKAKELRSKIPPGQSLAYLGQIDSNYTPKVITLGPAESVAGLGTEYAVNIKAFSMKPGEISDPIRGEEAYFIIELVSLNPASKQTFEAEKQNQFSMLNNEKIQRFFTQWFEKLKNEADIKDFRARNR